MSRFTTIECTGGKSGNLVWQKG